MKKQTVAKKSAPRKQKVSTKKINTTTGAREKKVAAAAVPPLAAVEEEPATIATDQIDLSPLNYRKYYSPAKLNELAESMRLHGLLENIVVRQHPDIKGRYQLAIGERRLRAAHQAGLPSLRAVIRELSDDQLREIQLVENLQREDPHPMHEAIGIAQLADARVRFEEIALRLGKSKTYVYNRLKLVNLTGEFQDIFLADRLTLTDALAIAYLQRDSQEELYRNHCAGWQEKEHFHLHNLNNLLSQYRYDLTRAPFDTKNKQLVEGFGPCTNCPHNTATLKTLFPEHATHAVCMNKTCYENKCEAHTTIALTAAYAATMPEAIVYDPDDTDLLEKLHTLFPASCALPVFRQYYVSTYSVPTPPDKADYFEADEDGEEVLDEAGYNEALEEYHSDREEYETLLKNGSLKKSLFISRDDISELYIEEDNRRPAAATRQTKVTAKEVQARVKEGTLTPELVIAAVLTMNEREARAKELDAEKILATIHEQFTEKTAEPASNHYSEIDRAISALLIYEALPYHARRVVDEKLFAGDKDEPYRRGQSTTYARFWAMTDFDYAYLVRAALTSKPESKNPRHADGFALAQVAAEAGVDVSAIKEAQAAKATLRAERLEARTQDLQRRLTGGQKESATADGVPVEAAEIAEG